MRAEEGRANGCFDYINDSELPPEDIDRILYHNAQELLGLPH